MPGCASSWSFVQVTETKTRLVATAHPLQHGHEYLRDLPRSNIYSGPKSGFKGDKPRDRGLLRTHQRTECSRVAKYTTPDKRGCKGRKASTHMKRPRKGHVMQGTRRTDRLEKMGKEPGDEGGQDKAEQEKGLK